MCAQIKCFELLLTKMATPKPEIWGNNSSMYNVFSITMYFIEYRKALIIFALQYDTHVYTQPLKRPDGKVHGGNMGPIWGRQDHEPCSQGGFTSQLVRYRLDMVSAILWNRLLLWKLTGDYIINCQMGHNLGYFVLVIKN